MNKNRKLTFDSHGLAVFSEYGIDPEGLKNLMIDMALKKTIFNKDGVEIPHSEAEDTLREMNLKFFDLTPGFTRREYRDALEDHGKQWFRILEEVEDFVVDYGIRENEIFNSLVNYRSRAHGEDNLFYIEADDIILSVSDVGTSAHDFSLQRLNEGKSYAVPTQRRGAAVGMELNRYLAGQEDWDKLVTTLAKSFVIAQQNEILAQLTTAASKLPVTSGFVGSGALNGTTKPQLDEIIYHVSLANGNAPAAIFGTQLALKKLNAIADVDWADDKTKAIMTNTGRLGTYEGTALVEIPNRFADKTLTDTIFDDTKLFIMAADQTYKLIDLYTEGDTEIVEFTSKQGAIDTGRRDDIGKYEIQMTWGTDVRVRRMFGQWTLPQS